VLQPLSRAHADGLVDLTPWKEVAWHLWDVASYSPFGKVDSKHKAVDVLSLPDIEIFDSAVYERAAEMRWKRSALKNGYVGFSRGELPASGGPRIDWNLRNGVVIAELGADSNQFPGRLTVVRNRNSEPRGVHESGSGEISSLGLPSELQLLAGYAPDGNRKDPDCCYPVSTLEAWVFPLRA
jgi:hypothetical protein